MAAGPGSYTNQGCGGGRDHGVCPCGDMTAGTNDFYPAGPGYNMVTGLGTPDAWNLVRDLAPLTGRAR